MLKIGVNDVSSLVYHSDREYLSSSVLKTINKDIEQYHREYILGLKETQPPGPALIEGSLTHTLILEPEKLHEEYAFFDGDIKKGPQYKSFEAANTGKVCISRPQKYRCDKLLAAYENCELAVNLMADTAKELSVCQLINDVPIKVRADAISVDRGLVLDIKTTGSESGLDYFKLTLNDLQYDLSAALYLRTFEQFYGRPFDFYFIVLSKRDLHCEVYRLGAASRQKGDEKVAAALSKYKKAKESNIWVETDMTETVNHGLEVREV